MRGCVEMLEGVCRRVRPEVEEAGSWDRSVKHVARLV